MLKRQTDLLSSNCWRGCLSVRRGAEVTDTLCWVLTLSAGRFTDVYETTCCGWNFIQKLQSCCHHSKIAPCVLEGVLFCFFVLSQRQMINDSRRGGELAWEKQEESWRAGRGAECLKYLGVVRRQGQQQGSSCSHADGAFTNQRTHNAWLTVDRGGFQRLKSVMLRLAVLFVEQKFSYGPYCHSMMDQSEKRRPDGLQ